MSGEGLVRLRGWLMGFAGLVCLAYAVLAIATRTPNPMPIFIPALAGVAASPALQCTHSTCGAIAASVARRAAHDAPWPGGAAYAPHQGRRCVRGGVCGQMGAVGRPRRLRAHTAAAQAAAPS